MELVYLAKENTNGVTFPNIQADQIGLKCQLSGKLYLLPFVYNIFFFPIIQ